MRFPCPFPSPTAVTLHLCNTNCPSLPFAFCLPSPALFLFIASNNPGRNLKINVRLKTLHSEHEMFVDTINCKVELREIHSPQKGKPIDSPKLRDEDSSSLGDGDAGPKCIDGDKPDAAVVVVITDARVSVNWGDGKFP